MKSIDRVGHRYGYLLVLSLDGSKGGQRYWRCVCKCGNFNVVAGSSLVSGATRSCGCFQRQAISALRKACIVHGHCRANKQRTKTYRAWILMRGRCNDPKNNSYERYGARGIKVCRRWLSFENFLSDMGVAPVGRSLDRINNNGPYTRSNCRWATSSEQARNKRSNVLIRYKGRRQCLLDWAKELGVSRVALRRRLLKGMSILQAVKDLQ